MEYLFSLILKACEKRNKKIKLMESLGTHDECRLHVSHMGKGYTITIKRNESYDLTQN